MNKPIDSVLGTAEAAELQRFGASVARRYFFHNPVDVVATAVVDLMSRLVRDHEIRARSPGRPELGRNQRFAYVRHRIMDYIRAALRNESRQREAENRRLVVDDGDFVRGVPDPVESFDTPVNLLIRPDLAVDATSFTSPRLKQCRQGLTRLRESERELSRLLCERIPRTVAA